MLSIRSLNTPLVRLLVSGQQLVDMRGRGNNLDRVLEFIGQPLRGVREMHHLRHSERATLNQSRERWFAALAFSP